MKFPAFHGTTRLIIVLITAHHWYLQYAETDEFSLQLQQLKYNFHLIKFDFVYLTNHYSIMSERDFPDTGKFLESI
jgi:hypothetical protein